MLAAHNIMVGNPRIFKQCFEQVNFKENIQWMCGLHTLTHESKTPVETLLANST